MCKNNDCWPRLKLSVSMDYGWVKQGMIFTFAEYLDRSRKFRATIEEAFLAQCGFFELQIDGVCSMEQSINEQFVADGTYEVTGSDTEKECQSVNREVHAVIPWCLQPRRYCRRRVGEAQPQLPGLQSLTKATNAALDVA